MPMEEVDDLMHITEQPVSLDAPADTDNRLALSDTLEDPGVQTPADIASQHLLGEELHRALSQLTSRERSVVILRYGIGDGRSRTLLEVGKSWASRASGSGNWRWSPSPNCAAPTRPSRFASASERRARCR